MDGQAVVMVLVFGPFLVLWWVLLALVVVGMIKDFRKLG